MKNKKGFTLVEILVCILIIGVLTTIALPVYLRAREKAKAAEAISVLGTVALAEHRYALLHNTYSSDFEKLDINIGDASQIENDVLKMNNFDVTIDEGIGGLKDTAYIRAYRKNNNNNILYSLYKCMDNNQTLCSDDDNTDNITCESLGFDSETNPMNPCGGMPINNASGCNSTGGFWSSAFGVCYETAQERCNAVSGTMDGDVCRFNDNNNSISDQILDNGMACYGSGSGSKVKNNQSGTVPHAVTGDNYSISTGSCINSIVNEGAVCYGNGQYGCGQSTVNEGGVCQVTNYGGCWGVTLNGGTCESGNGSSVKGCYQAVVNEGGVCHASSNMGCYASTINDGGVCIGDYQGSDGYGCKQVHVKSGGICVGSGYESCRQAIIDDGGIMIAKSSTAGLLNTYSGSGCCVDCVGYGYCHDSGHVCNMSAEEKDRYCHMYDEED